MKKIFTLIAVAMMALSTSAKEAIDFTQIAGLTYGQPFALGSWNWQGIPMSTGELVQNEEAKTADDSAVTYYDASAYDYIVIKYSALSGDVLMIAQYKCLGTIGQWGPEYGQGQITLDPSTKETYAALALDPASKATINSIALQGGNAGGSITIEEAYFATEAEWNEVKPAPAETKDFDFTSFGGYDAAQGKFVFAAGQAGWYSKWLGTFDPAGFASLVFEVASSAGDVQFLMQGDKADGSAENLMILASETPKTYALDLTGWTNISQMAFQNFYFSLPDEEDWNTKQASAQENTMVLTAMFLSIKPASEYTGIAGVKVQKAENAVRYNLAGQIVDDSYKGIVIENGKKILTK